MKSEYTTFDTATDGGFKPTPPGIYPAHVSSFDSNPWNESVVFNLIFKLADDVKEVQVPTGEQNGDGNFHVNKDDDGKTFSLPNVKILEPYCDLMKKKEISII